MLNFDISRRRPGKTFAFSPENPTGTRAGGSKDKPWEKNHPCISVKPGETLTLVDTDGPGRVQSMWIGGDISNNFVIRIYWDNSEVPSVECPLPAFFGYGFPENVQDQEGNFPTLNSAMIMVAPCRGMNCYWPMPFRKHCRITLTNRAPKENRWTYVMGATLNCCLAQNWFFDKVLETHDFRKMHRLAADVAPGSGGLFFLPYLTGERTPHMNPEARGMFFGMTLSHDRASMVRAVVEGISYALLDAMQCIGQLNPRIDRLILSGGGARSALWKQIIADMMNRPIYTTRMTEEAGIGAAVCAMVGTGKYADLAEACKAIVRYEDGCVEPIKAHTDFYREQHATYRALYEANRPLFPSSK